MHYNKKETYPPVECKLIILVDSKEVVVSRPPQYVNCVDDLLYLDEQGNEYKGGHTWRYL